MYVLINTLFLALGSSGVMTTAEFTNEKACNDVATKWDRETIKAFSDGIARFTAVCVAK
jgi:hypothetical protein